MHLRVLLSLLFCCGAAWWSVASGQAPSDLKIVTRETMFDGHGPSPPPFETTYYVKGTRIRNEWRASSGYSRNPKDPSSPTEYTYGPVIASIQQCDTQMGLEINTRDREYEVHPLPHYPTREELKALAAKHPQPTPKEKPKPTVTVERHTVDTGERKEFFGFVARHVITTTKNTPHEGSRTLPSETEEDGWFIDLKFRKSCMPELWSDESSGARLTVLRAGGVDAGPMDVYELKQTGPRETGFPVKVTRTYRSKVKMPDGSMRDSIHKMESEVVELATATLDPALFEAPKGFKKVDSIDSQPPVPAWARLYMWWERLKARLFR